MTTEEKSKEILSKILEIINEGDNFTFESDWGENTATIYKGRNHTHVGVPDGNFDTYINNLYETLVKNKGLSWE